MLAGTARCRSPQEPRQRGPRGRPRDVRTPGRSSHAAAPSAVRSEHRAAGRLVSAREAPRPARCPGFARAWEPSRSTACCSSPSGARQRDQALIRRPAALLRATRLRSATDRKHRGAALGTVALPACPTVRQRYLVRVGDGDLRSADASTLRPRILRRWVRVGHGEQHIRRGALCARCR
jgi:hypothetical protein